MKGGNKTGFQIFMMVFYMKRRKNRVNNDFKGDYFIEKQKNIYKLIRAICMFSVRLRCRRKCCPKTLKLNNVTWKQTILTSAYVTW